MAIGSLQFDLGDDMGGFLDPEEDDEVGETDEIDGTPVRPSRPRASSSCWLRFMA